jgi:predicted RNase H-like nuclease (RuvC/YqgF family)
MTSAAGKTAEVSAEELKAAVKSTPSLAVVLKMFNGLGKTVTRLADFSRDMDAKNRQRNKSIEALEERAREAERRLASVETRLAVAELRSAKP